MDSYADLTAFSQRKRKVGKGGAVSAVTMKITLVLAATLSMFVFACDKSSSSGAENAGKDGGIVCEKVVEKIASLNPPDMRGEPEKKLWRGMCGEMKPEEKTCVMGAANMDAMKACMKK